MESTVALLMLAGTGMAGATQYLFDFQGHPDTHPGVTEAGYTPITPATPLYSAGQGYGLMTTAEGGRLRGGTDDLLRDFLFEESGEQLIFRVDLPNGLYDVQSWSGDMDFARGSLRMIISFDGGATEHILYGCDAGADSPLPGTFMTDFVDSGTPGAYDQIIPDGKTHSGANYRMEATEFLQVHDQIEVTGGSLTFMVGSGDRTLNGIAIELVPEPATMLLLGVGACLIRRKK